MKTQYYTYNEITGTLYELCEIFNKDINDVQQILKHYRGFLFLTEALEKAPFKKVQRPINSETYEIPVFSLSEKQWELEKIYHKNFDNFVNNRKIVNEDLKSDLYMCYLFIISKISEPEDKKNHYYSTKIFAELKKCYIQLCKKEYAKKQIKSLNNSIAVEPIYDIDNNVYQEQLKKEIQFSLEELALEEKKLIRLRFGLDGNGKKTRASIGRIMNVTVERARQIEHKALRKLRHPNCSKKLRDFLIFLE